MKLPPLGGDTLWADMAKAYDLLDDDTKELIDDKKATHDYASAFGFDQPPEVQEQDARKHPTVEHPIVRTHPETGRRTLYVNCPSPGESSAWSRRRPTPSSGASTASRRSSTSSAASGGAPARWRSGTTAPPSTS